MNPTRLYVALLGKTLIDIQLGPAPAPAPVETTNDPGSVTERRTTATIGFSSAAALPRDRRPVVRSEGPA